MEEFVDSLMYDYELDENDYGHIDNMIDDMILERVQKEEREADWELIDETEIKYIYQDKNNPHFYKEVSKDGSSWSTYKKYN